MWWLWACESGNCLGEFDAKEEFDRTVALILASDPTAPIYGETDEPQPSVYHNLPEWEHQR